MTRYSHAHWLFQHNGGVFLPPWGKIEQWLISVQHDESDIDRLVAQLPRLRRRDPFAKRRCHGATAFFTDETLQAPCESSIDRTFSQLRQASSSYADRHWGGGRWYTRVKAGRDTACHAAGS